MANTPSGKKKGSARAGCPCKDKTTPKRRFKTMHYTQHRLEEAIQLVKAKTITLGEASRHRIRINKEDHTFLLL